MTIVSNCRNCGAPLGRTSIEAFVPYCDSCGTSFMGLGGALGITSAFERNDPALNRKLVESQILALDEAVHKYNGMIEHCKQQLLQTADAYAALPPKPELLSVQSVPPVFSGVLVPAVRIGFMPGCPVAVVVLFIVLSITARSVPFLRGVLEEHFGSDLHMVIRLVWYGFPLAVIAIAAVKQLQRMKVIDANGARPEENARRVHMHMQATSAAIIAAAPIKDAADHRFRRQIVELEGQRVRAERNRQELKEFLRTL
ncbi:MAG: hypothetical protein ABI779_21670 [Acidobacteriota bacterium]